MSTSLVINGVSYLYPDTGDQSWGTVASAWAAAVTSGMLQKAAGTFTLTADVNFGASFGVLSKYFTSTTASPSTAGILRLASADSVGWRNNANGANILLAKDTSDRLTYNGIPIVSSSGIIPVSAGGTGLSSGTSGGILGFTGSGTLASSAALTASQLIIGGGAGATPSTLAAGSQYQVLVMGASNPGYGQVNLAQSAAVTGILPNANTTAASANTASAIVARDGSGNFSAGTITATLSGIATNVSGVVAVANGGTGLSTLTANNIILGNGASSPSFVAPSTAGNVLQSNGTTWISATPAAATYVAPKVTTYTSGTGTHTFTGSPLYVVVEAAGAGGGGAGSSTQGANDGGNGGTGGNTTFGSSLITASGGVGATHGLTAGGAGGAASRGAADGLAIAGGAGGGASASSANSGTWPGRAGAASAFGGAGIGDTANGQMAGVTNSGGGGSGGSFNSSGANAGYEGSGGGAGGYVKAWISGSTLSGLSGSASYAVGAAGTAGSAGTSGNAGAAGGSGILIITEYYQ